MTRQDGGRRAGGGLRAVFVVLGGIAAAAGPGCGVSANSDPCLDERCSGHGACENVAGSALCRCDTGYRAASRFDCVPVSLDGPPDEAEAGADADAPDDAAEDEASDMLDTDAEVETADEDGSDADAGPACGDGRVDTGEQCDDGNLVSGDGCSDGCILECGDDTFCLEHRPDPACMSAWCLMDVHLCDFRWTLYRGYADNDGDTFGDPAGTRGCGLGFVDDNTDCCDSEPRVRPNQVEWFAETYDCGHGGPEWDWNCSGTEERQYPSSTDCQEEPPLSGTCVFAEGWVPSMPPVPLIPGCGETGLYVGDPASCGPGMMGPCSAEDAVTLGFARQQLCH